MRNARSIVLVLVASHAVAGDAAAESIWTRYKTSFDRLVEQVVEYDLYGLTAQNPKGVFGFKLDWNMRRATGRYSNTGERTPLVQPLEFGDSANPDLALDLGASGHGGGYTMQFSYGITDPLDFYFELPLQYMTVQVRPKLRRMSLLTAAMINGMLPAGYPPIDPNWFTGGATKQQYLNEASGWIIDYLKRLGRPSLGDSQNYPEDLGPGKAFDSNGVVLADINCGFAWNFHRSSRWSGALTGRVFLPTGNMPNPDNAFTLGTGAELPHGTGSLGLGFTQGYDIRLYRYKHWVDIAISGEVTASYYIEGRRRYPSFPKPTDDGNMVLDLLDPERLYFPDMSDLSGKSYGYTPGLGFNTLLTLSVSSLIFSAGIGIGYAYFQEPEYDADPRFVSMVRNMELELAGHGEALRASVSVLLAPLYIPGKVAYQYEHSISGHNMLIFDRNHWITFNLYFPTVIN